MTSRDLIGMVLAPAIRLLCRGFEVALVRSLPNYYYTDIIL